MRKIIPFIIIVTLFVVTTSTIAYSKNQQTYGNLVCEFVKNYDGDTITVNISDVHPIIGKHISIRINGIDTPELRGTTGKIKEKARTAKKMVTSLCKKAKILELRNIKRGKYFRIVADVYVGGQCLADILIKNGLAKPYDGGKKPQW